MLFENPDNAGGLNHLGVEVEEAAQVAAAEARVSEAGLESTGVQEVTCCFADKTETWVDGPDTRWEWYVKVKDRDGAGTNTIGWDTDSEAAAGCCA